MANENLIHDSKFYCKLEEWNNLNSCACDIEEAIAVLAGKRRHTWSIAHLVADLAKTVEARTLALEEMKPFGVTDYEAAISYACKMIPTA